MFASFSHSKYLFSPFLHGILWTSVDLEFFCKEDLPRLSPLFNHLFILQRACGVFIFQVVIRCHVTDLAAQVVPDLAVWSLLSAAPVSP